MSKLNHFLFDFLQFMSLYLYCISQLQFLCQEIDPNLSFTNNSQVFLFVL